MILQRLKKLKKENKRLNNIELLRIISMFMVLVLHFLSFTGILQEYNNLSLKSFITWFLESLSFCAVNIYVIISGYFLIDSKFKIQKIIKIWLEVLFYSIILFFTLYLTKQISFDTISCLKSFFPIILGNYWFVTVYIALYILSPFINKFIRNLNKQQYKILLLIIFVMFSFLQTIIPANYYKLNYGGSYSICWFICLYLFSGYLKKFPFDKESNKNKYLICYLSCAFINVAMLFVLKIFNITIIDNTFLYNYYSITVLIEAISLFLYFKNLKIKNKVLITFISLVAPTTFGVYLIHENPNVRLVLWQSLSFVLNNNIFYTCILFVIIPLFLFLIFSFIDRIRILIFDKIHLKNNNNSKVIKIFKSLEEIVNYEN